VAWARILRQGGENDEWPERLGKLDNVAMRDGAL